VAPSAADVTAEASPLSIAADTVTAAPVQGSPSNVDQTPTLQGVLDAWGQTGSTMDLNASGLVDMDDVLQFLNGVPVSSGTPESGDSQAPAGLVSHASRARSAAAGGLTTAAGSLQKLTDSLIDRLGSVGFKDQPPTNIRQLVDGLNLSPRQSDQMLAKLSARYPNGLGVNYVA
jgi:hypothetical protein